MGIRRCQLTSQLARHGRDPDIIGHNFCEKFGLLFMKNMIIILSL